MVSNNVYVCIYYILLLLLLLLYIYIRNPEILSGPLSNGEKQSIFFSEGDPPLSFSGFSKIGLKLLVSLPNKPEKWFQVYSGFSGFYSRKKTFPSELVLHLKNIQCDR